MGRHQKTYDGELFTKKLIVAMTPDEYERLRAAATSANKSISRFVRLALGKAIEGQIYVSDPITREVVSMLQAIGERVNQVAGASTHVDVLEHWRAIREQHLEAMTQLTKRRRKP